MQLCDMFFKSAKNKRAVLFLSLLKYIDRNECFVGYFFLSPEATFPSNYRIISNDRYWNGKKINVKLIKKPSTKLDMNVW